MTASTHSKFQPRGSAALPSRPALLAAALTAALSACGGGEGGTATTDAPSLQATADAQAASKVEAITVGSFPHPVDVYNTAGATRAIVALHGGGGNKINFAYALGMNSRTDTVTNLTANWTWLMANKVMLVMPQGQHKATASANTWNNRVMDSGQADKDFLAALATRIRQDYGITKLTLMGHSMGGAMTNRMWCESSTTFDTYASLAGPASTTFNSASTPCRPVAAKPYLGIIGDGDSVMQTTGAWWADSWTINPVLVNQDSGAWVNPNVIAEFRQQQTRTMLACNATLGQNDYVHSGNVDTWTSCGGKLALKRVLGADHGVDSLGAQIGGGPTAVMDTIMQFVGSN